MIDILFLAHNRLEYTRESLKTLIRNTDWDIVRKFVIYDDASTDGTREFLASMQCPKREFRAGAFGGPVDVMNDYLSRDYFAGMVAKVDNDTMVPPGWLGQLCKGMAFELDLLGMEAFNPVDARPVARGYTPANFIGGIGLMRHRAFQYSVPRPGGRFGFTAWQEHARKENDEKVKAGWLNPSIPVFLLDHLPMEPWRSLGAEYVRRKWQREWPPYHKEQASLWSWWGK